MVPHVLLALAQLSSPEVAWDGPALVADDGKVFLSRRCEGALAPAPAVEEKLGAGPYVIFGEAGSRRVDLVELGRTWNGALQPSCNEYPPPLSLRA